LLVRPASKPLLVQWLILSAAVTALVVVPFAGLPPLLFIVVPTVLVVAAYPWPSKLANVRVPRIDRPLAALTTLAAAALAASVWQNLTWQLDSVGGEHATEAHWALDAAHVILLLAAGALASTRQGAGEPLPSSPASPSSTWGSLPSRSLSRREAGAPWEERWAWSPGSPTFSRG
jgi:hypothetical protein